MAREYDDLHPATEGVFDIVTSKMFDWGQGSGPPYGPAGIVAVGLDLQERLEQYMPGLIEEFYAEDEEVAAEVRKVVRNHQRRRLKRELAGADLRP